MKASRRRHMFKREALLALSRNYGRFLFLSCFLLFSLAATVFVSKNASEFLGRYLCSDTMLFVRKILLFFGVMLFSPLFCGIFSEFYILFCKKQNGSFGVLFFYESFPRYRKACLMGLSFLCLCELTRLLSYADKLWNASVPFESSSLGGGIHRIICGLGEASMISVILYAFLFLAIATLSQIRKDKSFADLLLSTHRMLCGKQAELFSLTVSFVPIFVISHFTFGILTVAYSLPLFVLTLCSFSAYADCERFVAPAIPSLATCRPIEELDEGSLGTAFPNL